MSRDIYNNFFLFYRKVRFWKIETENAARPKGTGGGQRQIFFARGSFSSQISRSSSSSSL